LASIWRLFVSINEEEVSKGGKIGLVALKILLSPKEKIRFSYFSCFISFCYEYILFHLELLKRADASTTKEASSQFSCFFRSSTNSLKLVDGKHKLKYVCAVLLKGFMLGKHSGSH